MREPTSKDTRGANPTGAELDAWHTESSFARTSLLGQEGHEAVVASKYWFTSQSSMLFLGFVDSSVFIIGDVVAVESCFISTFLHVGSFAFRVLLTQSTQPFPSLDKK